MASDDVSNERPHPAVLEAEPAPVRPARRGAGPVWDDGAGELLWVDTAGQVRWGRVDAAGGVRDLAVRPVGEPVAAGGPTTTTRWLGGGRGGFPRGTPGGGGGGPLDPGGGGRGGGGGRRRPR